MASPPITISSHSLFSTKHHSHHQHLERPRPDPRLPRRLKEGSMSLLLPPKSPRISTISYPAIPAILFSISSASKPSIVPAFICTKNAEFVDDLLTFQELGEHMKFSGCHVANLWPLEFYAKNGIGCCVSSCRCS
ncbi:hypothetical protein J5N97_018873 [Dioscorea zingiberensis]|uniref:Uncharacterized protein n=1 Tax=Dioscorea zingiberensis TaxID=325984 RepID=A0A9D5CDJ3_9LILI|nr:hypothetical protein J5N97_018873 [Dioscorea zingiberensis]